MAFEIKQQQNIQQDVQQDGQQDVQSMSENSPMMDQFSPNQANQNNQLNPLQLQLSEPMENIIVDIVMSDYESSKQAKSKVDYGLSSKGDKLDFEKFFSGITDLYNSRRIPKDKPWKFCSNRSLRIAASILDMLHARLYPSVVNEDLHKWRAVEYKDVPKAERISLMMRWWLFVNSRCQDFFDKWIKIIVGYGDALVETCYSVTTTTTNEVMEQPVTNEAGQPLINPDGTPAVVKSRKWIIKKKHFHGRTRKINIISKKDQETFTKNL